MRSRPLPQLAANLKAARSARMLTQRQVAEAMRSRGNEVWQQTIVARVEHGRRPVWCSELVDMAQIYGQTVTSLLGRPDDSADACFEDVESILPALSTRDLSRVLLLAASLMYERNEGGTA